jgi:DNA topoisomerase-3
LILQQPVERAQMEKLLATGRTDLLTGFMSRKNRKFKAFLVKTPGGKIGFEFQPRAPRPVKAAKPAAEVTPVTPIRKSAGTAPAPAKARRPGSARRARSTR